MTSIVKIVAVAMVVGVLCVGAVALATDFTWDSSTADTSWVTANNWDQNSSYPQNANDNTTIDDAGFLCTFDPESDLTINNLALAGASPTKRKLHIKDAALTVANLDLNDYAELDVDQDLTVTGTTTLAGDVFIEVAVSTTFDMEDVAVAGASTSVGGIGIGTIKADEVVIDAETDGASRTLKWSAGTLDIENQLSLTSSQTANTYIAKLWVYKGTVAIAAAGNGVLKVDGGNDPSRRAELDIDGPLTAEQTDFEDGYVTIDVASLQTATGGDVVFKAGAIVTKTGSGTFKSGA